MAEVGSWIPLVTGFGAGLILGLIYFGGLWYTIRAMPRVRRPALLFAVSFVVRLVIVLAAIYLLGAGDWRPMVTALVGMILVRIVLTRTLGPAHKQLASPTDKKAPVSPTTGG